MDWYEWLRRAGLGDDLAAKYALLFARNQLGAADVRHLDHAFLATMGVAVAKHRLEILKLARKDSPASAAITVLPWRATRLLAAATRRSAQSLAACLRSAARRGRRASAVAPHSLALCHQWVAGPARWKSAPSTPCFSTSPPSWSLFLRSITVVAAEARPSTSPAESCL